MKIKPIIMAGGLGTRLWPLSCNLNSKQFIKIFNKTSLFQETLVRNKFLGKATIIVREEHKLTAIQQAEEINVEVDLIIEPTSKNTAPCAIIAALHAKYKGFDVVILLPSDHYIVNDNNYIMTINKSLNYINNFCICTIGIKPSSPNIEYGYIKIQKPIINGVYETTKFIAKATLIEIEDLSKTK